MGRPTKHIRHQGPVLRTLGLTAVEAIKQRFVGMPKEAPTLPGEVFEATVPPRPKALVRDYVRSVGGDPSAYKRTLPPHLFPQWGFPILSKTLKNLPYPLFKVLNGGCRVEIKSALPVGEPLHVRARLESIDDNGRRAVLHQSLTTGTATAPDAVTAHLYAIVPLPKKSGGESDASKNKAKPKPKARVPHVVDELERWRLAEDAGLHFAMLTGDFNPVHWIGPYARAFGFKNTILHGFATMARAWEGMNRRLYSGDITAISSFDVQFTRPLVLPRKVGLYVDGHEAFVGDAPGGPAYLVGKFETRS